MIKLSDIEKVYRTDKIETLALKDINIHVQKGDLLSVMGPSGCGKSTLLNIMGLLDDPSRGTVEIEGHSVQKFKDKKMASFRNHKIGFVFQSFHLINDLSVVDNVEIPLLYRRMSGSERRKRALAALEKVGLSARTKHFPSQLSGGQRQRVAIARAIVGEPEIILADEPTGNLDSNMGQEIIDILFNLNKNDHTTIVMVTHDEHIADQTGHIIRLFDGSQVN
ncbi:ABC transporter ATP-binding protein [candidate division KSB1 bacterium]|nr:ABC transporter ATP-binding protein [candidate division KSB1 bacterium]